MTIRGLGSFVCAALMYSSSVAACPGDCDGDEAVSVNEVIVAVRVLLDRAPLSDCVAIDADGDGAVTVGELVVAVRSGLDGCSLCGNGRIDPGEECDAGDPEVQCFTDCTVCCSGNFDCTTSRCCWDGPEGGLVRFDPECRECGEIGQSCGYSTFYDSTCCEGLTCGDLREFEGRALIGTCCALAGSACLTDDDCCGPNDSGDDACVDGTCSYGRSGGQCEPGAANPCRDPAERCLHHFFMNEIWHTCRVPPPSTPLPEPCVREFCKVGDFEAPCCGANEVCERVVREGVRACCLAGEAPGTCQ